MVQLDRLTGLTGLLLLKPGDHDCPLLAHAIDPSDGYLID